MSPESQMIKVGTVEDLRDGKRILANVEGREVVVIGHDGDLFAFENYCPHLGGPACQGKLAPRVEGVIDEDGSLKTERFVTSEMQIVCPWHGVEFDLRTGICAADPVMRLRRRDVVQKEDDIFIAEREAEY